MNATARRTQRMNTLCLAVAALLLPMTAQASDLGLTGAWEGRLVTSGTDEGPGQPFQVVVAVDEAARRMSYLRPGESAPEVWTDQSCPAGSFGWSIDDRIPSGPIQRRMAALGLTAPPRHLALSCGPLELDLVSVGPGRALLFAHFDNEDASGILTLTPR